VSLPDKSPDELAALMSTVSLTPKTRVCCIFHYAELFSERIRLSYTGDLRENPRSLVPRKRPREETEAPVNGATSGGNSKSLWLISYCCYLCLQQTAKSLAMNPPIVPLDCGLIPLRRFHDSPLVNKRSTSDKPSTSKPPPFDVSSLNSHVSMPKQTANLAKMEDNQLSPIQGLSLFPQRSLRTCVPETFSTCNLTLCTTQEVMRKLQELPSGQRPPTPYALSIVDSGAQLTFMRRMPKPCAGCGAVPHNPMIHPHATV
jgi:hypothetical protein